EMFEHNNQDIIQTFADSYDLVLIDEFQDISGIQYDIIEELTSTIGMDKLTVIGDEDQASLVGSEVLMQGGTTKKVEDIEIGDRVVSYKMGDAFELSSDTKFGKGYEVLDKRMHSEEGALEVVTESGQRSTYSQGHKAIAKFSVKVDKDVRVFYMYEYEEGLYQIVRSDLYGYLKSIIERGFSTTWLLHAYDKLGETERELLRYEEQLDVKFHKKEN